MENGSKYFENDQLAKWKDESYGRVPSPVYADNPNSKGKGKGKTKLKEEFDGHANCFIETGNNKALLIDFNYKFEPLEGTFPIAGIGPLKLLKESLFNHWGKLAFRWIYWNMLLKGIPIPMVSPQMTTKGKKIQTIK